jgi:hypothetical protein
VSYTEHVPTITDRGVASEQRMLVQHTAASHPLSFPDPHIARQLRLASSPAARTNTPERLNIGR